MRQPRTTVVLLLIALGILGAWLGLCAQERHTEWPPASPLVPTVGTSGDGDAVSATPVKNDASVSSGTVIIPPPPSALPADIVATENLDAAVGAAQLPPKLPAEIPTQPQKAEAQPPPPLRATPSAPGQTDAPKQVIIPGPPPLNEPPERLPAPRVKESTPVVVPPPAFPDIPKIDLPGDKNNVAPPPADIGAKPQAPPVNPPAPPVPAPEPPPVPQPAPLTALPEQKQPEVKQPPPVPQPAPLTALPEQKQPATAIDVKQPVPVPQPAPLLALPDNKQPAPPIDVKQPVPVPQPAPLTALPDNKQSVPPVEIKQAAPPSRPPAFLIVKPRRIEAPAPPPPPTAPYSIAPPALVDAPRVPEVPLASSAAQVTVEKRGPSVLHSGAAASYQILVRNRGAASSGPITVVDEIPRLARILSGDPAPAQQGDKAIWTLSPLPANGETVLKLELEATGSGDFVGNTTVFVSAANAVTRAKVERDPTATPVSSGPLAIVVRGPVGGAIGQPVVFEVQVTNRGKQFLSELVLHARLSEGLTHPAGNNIEADIGDLAPGASKTFKMPTTAVRSGRQTADVRITAAGGVEAKSQAFVLITSSGLSIQTPQTSRLLLDRDGDIRIEVTNLQAAPLRNVVIADLLPDTLQFVAASDRGIYQATTRTVQWLIDALPAGETRAVTLRVHGKTPGQFAKEVSARAESMPETRAQSLVLVEAFADLAVKLTPRDQPLELGKDTVCEVRVQNLGSSTATGVQLQLVMPPGLAPGYVQGPTSHRVQGRTLIFEPIAQLATRTQAVYHVGVTAQAAGDLRLRAQAVSDQTRTPVAREISLNVYRD